MAEREADRLRPELLTAQAARALILEVEREISPSFRRALNDIAVSPGLFDAVRLTELAQSGLELAIARNLSLAERPDHPAAISDALRDRTQGYVREQKCCLVADRHPEASLATVSLENALNAAVTLVGAMILSGDRPRIKRVESSDNLLVRPLAGVAP